jgi:1,4-dihydroxy-2-naphthoate octaprenyltransferase
MSGAWQNVPPTSGFSSPTSSGAVEFAEQFFKLIIHLNKSVRVEKGRYNQSYMPKFKIERLIAVLRPQHFITWISMYLLGAGLTHFLGKPFQPRLFWLGLIWLTSLLLGLILIGDHFETPFDRGLTGKMGYKGVDTTSSEPVENLELFLGTALLISTAVFSIFLLQTPGLPSAVILIMLMAFFLSAGLVMPGVNLAASGFGELISSVVLILLPPALGFWLQQGEFHSLLALSVFPLFPLHLGMLIFLQLPDFAQDLRLGNVNFLTRAGWVRGVFIHNLLVITGYLLLGLSTLFGFPSRITLIILFSIPLAFYLVWYLSRLERGAPTRWPELSILSISTFFLPVYIMTYSFWI